MASYRNVDEGVAQIIREIQLVVFDFDGVFTDNSVYVFEDGREAVRCSRFDGIGLRRLEISGVQAFVLSTETNPVVSRRAQKLRISCQQGCEDKLAALIDIMGSRNLVSRQLAFVGNDINDLECLRVVGFPIVVRDCHPDVLSEGRYVTKRCGGQGAVREVCDLIASIREGNQSI